MSQSRILLVDAYDSFTYNLSDQLSRCTSAQIHTIHIDAPFTSISDLVPCLASFDAVIIGPGPGTPDNPRDIGIARDIWHLADEHLLPVFGVCLGLQSLCLEFGGTVERLHTVKHGLTADIRHSGVDLYEGVGKTAAVRYHSLHARLPSEGSQVLEPLAWATDAENGEVLMAVKHRTKPFWAVQYHPESICTEKGDGVVQNFWRMAEAWNKAHGRAQVELPAGWPVRPQERSLLEQIQLEGDEFAASADPVTTSSTVQTMALNARGLDVQRICERLGVESADQFILLDSAANPGKFSIIGILSPSITRQIRYHVGDNFATLSTVQEPSTQRIPLRKPFTSSVWKYLASYVDARKATDGHEDSPFWGGLMGYFTYELGVDNLSIPLAPRTHSRPDVNLAFIERSIVLNTHTGDLYIQSLLPNDSVWLTATKLLLQTEQSLTLTPSTTPPPSSPRTPQPPTITSPSRTTYTSLVTAAQSHLHAGNSYELCLTSTTTLTLPVPAPHPWTLYTRLRTRNPAPYAAYLRLTPSTLLSSSPERFLSYTRQGTVQQRPIKGTLARTPTTTLASATAALSTQKERAENLMILDLIRHDLHGICGAGAVAVSTLMGVEEYKTVYQLVSAIDGTLPPEGTLGGFDVLKACLPPGSMTGAPKRRSVEILQELEKRERGVYSGVVGYHCVGGAGDWSVVIRAAVEWEGKEGVWEVGAGGAVTALSSPVDEWEEMRVKVRSAASAFGG